MKKLITLLFLFILCTPVHAQTGQLQAGQIWGNPTAAAKPATGTTVGAILDREYSCTGRGSLIMRGAALWGCLVPGSTAGWPLTTTGTGADLAYARLGLIALATGTQDTIIGYFGSTSASAIAINNCTGALTYSTGTHTFGCNATAGTGNVVNSGTPTVNQFGLWVNSTTLAGTDAATKAQQQTGSSAVNPVTPSQQQSHDSAAKVTWTGISACSPCTAGGSFGVASVTHPSAGNWVVTFTTPFTSASYACLVNTATASGNGILSNVNPATKTVNAVALQSYTTAVSSTDPTDSISVACFGRQ